MKVRFIPIVAAKKGTNVRKLTLQLFTSEREDVYFESEKKPWGLALAAGLRDQA
jgi:hypothetical protein